MHIKMTILERLTLGRVSIRNTETLVGVSSFQFCPLTIKDVKGELENKQTPSFGKVSEGDPNHY